jgi:hypothetical protein
VLLMATTACGSDSDGSTAEPRSEADASVAATQPDSAASAAAPDAATSDTPATTTPPTDTGGPAETEVTEAPVVVPEALAFTAPLVGGGTFDGAAAAAAGKPTVFWFWAPT